MGVLRRPGALPPGNESRLAPCAAGRAVPPPSAGQAASASEPAGAFASLAGMSGAAGILNQSSGCPEAAWCSTSGQRVAAGALCPCPPAASARQPRRAGSLGAFASRRRGAGPCWALRAGRQGAARAGCLSFSTPVTPDPLLGSQPLVILRAALVFAVKKGKRGFNFQPPTHTREEKKRRGEREGGRERSRLSSAALARRLRTPPHQLRGAARKGAAAARATLVRRKQLRARRDGLRDLHTHCVRAGRAHERAVGVD